MKISKILFGKYLSEIEELKASNRALAEEKFGLKMALLRAEKNNEKLKEVLPGLVKKLVKIEARANMDREQRGVETVELRVSIAAYLIEDLMEPTERRFIARQASDEVYHMIMNTRLAQKIRW